MATQPKPKPKPEPKPEPEPDEDDAARGEKMIPPQYRAGGLHAAETTDASDEGVTLLERVENLENRMTAVEERQNAPPIGLGRRA
jgi:hypothetical protein